MKNLATRSLTAIVFLVVMVGSALLGQMVFSVLFLLVTILGLNEFLGLISTQTLKPARVYTIAAGAAMFSLLALNAMEMLPLSYLLIIFPLLFLVFLIELWRNLPNPFHNIAYAITALLYIAVPFGMVMYFFNTHATGIEHYALVLGFFFIIWLNDTGAYFVGSMIGKHKLFERISPGKTWEGSIGGGVFALLTAYGFSFLSAQLTVPQWLGMALIIVFTATLGDLVESLLKRSLGIKDSGNIMPGHGGILDRFDAVLLSAPFVFVYLTLIGR